MIEPSNNAAHDTVLDVTAQQVARVYAQGLLGAAVKAGQVDEVVEELDALVQEVLQPNPGLERALTSALIASEDKEKMLHRVFGGRVSQIALSFLKVLARHGRLELLRDVQRELRTLYNQHRNLVEVEVRAAREIDGATLEKLKQTLRARLGSELIMDVKVDPSLIAGVVIRVGDTVYDASVETRFRRAREAMVRQAVDLIQARREHLVSA